VNSEACSDRANFELNFKVGSSTFFHIYFSIQRSAFSIANSQSQKPVTETIFPSPPSVNTFVPLPRGWPSPLAAVQPTRSVP
jgi:hypothetical protein